MRDRPGEDSQHAPNALEVRKCGCFRGQDIKDFWVDRVAYTEFLNRLGVIGFRGETFLIRYPQTAIRGNDLIRLRIIDTLKQPAAKYLYGFVIFGRVQQSRLASGNALGLGHTICDIFVLGGISVHRLTVFANRQRIHQRRSRRTFNRLKKRGQGRR